MRVLLYEEACVYTLAPPWPAIVSASLGRLATKPLVHTDVAATAGRRALVVDDEPTIRSALLRYLRRTGWVAEEAEDGRVALSILGKSGLDGYQVVVSDLRMPHCSGVELHDWLAEHRPDLFARLIITTGDLASPAWRDFIARTTRPLIEKPFDLAVLAQLIEAVARGR
ncbi:MAG TPA: response regulator [Gemmatimonadales bacterium]|nr:response regulator [Gemmatimonadales bacterium]